MTLRSQPLHRPRGTPGVPREQPQSGPSAA